ncbi:PAS domain-containing protein [Candidatus Reidiella endopervernicosa]|uniref:PAS domain-containing protein n=1 Tax=Candidatus Reidiella endopervernicosa TaxID=2738883 RepID=A0A6N0HZF7_9GAMM|nr:PAS domain-containing protein [Candidatus Reidiella endopervernicosa]
MLVTNTEGKIVSANPAFSRITGYSEADAVGQSPHLLNSGLQSKGFFDLMWRQLRETDHWQGKLLIGEKWRDLP